MKYAAITVSLWIGFSTPQTSRAAEIPAEQSADEGQKRLLEQARRHVGRGEHDQADTIYRQLLADAPSRLCEVSAGHYRCLGDCCWSDLAGMGRKPEAFPRRRSQGAPAVKRRFEAAMSAGDIPVLEELADGLFWNPFGEQALDRLGEVHLAQGRAERASECWQRLIELRDRADPSLALWKAKAACAYHQLGDDATVRGILSWLKLSAPEARATIAGQDCLLVEHVQGLLEAGNETAGRRGDWPMPGGWPSRSAIGAPLAGFGGLLWKSETTSQPLVSVAEGTAFVLTADKLTAFDLATGRLKWNMPWQAKADDPATSFAPTVSDGLVFLPDREQASTIVGIEAATGELAVRFAAAVAKDATAVVDGSPVAFDGRVYWSFRSTDVSTTAYFVRAVDLASKRLLWQTKVCETSAKVARSGRPAPLAAFGSVLVAPTGMGLVAGLDADTGAIKWASEYAGVGHILAGRTSVPPIVAGGIAHVAPSDANVLLGIDLRTGVLRWQTTVGNAATLLPPQDGAVPIVDTSITAVGSLSGKSRWRSDDPAAGPVAPPWNAGRLLLWPCAERVLTLDASSGKLRSPVVWPAGAEAGRIMTCGEVVLILAAKRIEVYQNSEP